MKRSSLLALLLVFMVAFGAVPDIHASSNSPFSVVGVQWGTSTKPAEAGPGSANVLLTVTMSFTGGIQAQSVRGVLQLGSATLSGQGASAFTDINGGRNSTASAFSVNPDSTFTLTYDLDVLSGAKLGTYSIPLEIQYTNSAIGNSGGYYAQALTVSVPMLGVTGLTFGAASPALVAGKVNQVTLDIGDGGTGGATSIAVSLSATGASLLGSVPELASISPGQVVPENVSVYVPKGASGSVSLVVTATYYDAYGLSQSTSQSVGLYVSGSSAPLLAYSASGSSVPPGESSVAMSLSNFGSAAADQISTTVTCSPQCSVIGGFPFVASLQPGASTKSEIGVYAQSPQSSITLSISADYVDPYGNAGTYTQTLGLYVTSNSSSAPPLRVDAVQDVVTAGADSRITFSFKNTGNYTIYSPVYSVTATSPLVLVQNSTFSAAGTSIPPGGSQAFTPVLTASPSATSGIYQAKLQLSFEDQAGASHSATFQVAISLTGSVDLVVQDEKVSQNLTGITITGNLLNEGSSPAYYSSVYATLNGSKSIGAPNYLGEIDVNSPTPFSISVPYHAGKGEGTGNVTVVAEYKNSLGQASNSSSSSTTRLYSAQELSPAPSQNQPQGGVGLSTLDLVLVMGGIFVAAGVAVFAVARRRGRSSRASEGDESLQVD